MGLGDIPDDSNDYVPKSCSILGAYDVIGRKRLIFMGKWGPPPHPAFSGLITFFIMSGYVALLFAGAEMVIMFTCFDLKIQPEHRHMECTSKLVSEQSASILGLYTILSGTPCLAYIILFGKACDRFGRRLFLGLPMIGAFLYVLSCFIILQTPSLKPPDPEQYWKHPDDPSTWKGTKDSPWKLVFLVVATVTGLTGGVSASLMAMFAYASDASPPERRGFWFSTVEIMTGGGRMVGSVLTGYMIRDWGLTATFFITLMWIVLGVVILLLTPESLNRRDIGDPLVWSDLNVFRAFKILVSDRKRQQIATPEIEDVPLVVNERSQDPSAYGPIFQKRMRRGFCGWFDGLVMLCILFPIGVLASVPSLTLTQLYYGGNGYRYPTDKIGLVGASGSAGRFFGGTLLLPLIHRYCTSEPREFIAVKLMMVVCTACSCLCGTVRSYEGTLAIWIVNGTVLAPAFGIMRSMITNRVLPSEQGQMLSVILVVEGGVFAIGPAIANYFYSLGLKADHVGLPWYVFSAGYALVGLCIGYLTPLAHRKSPRHN